MFKFFRSVKSDLRYLVDRLNDLYSMLRDIHSFIRYSGGFHSEMQSLRTMIEESLRQERHLKHELSYQTSRANSLDEVIQKASKQIEKLERKNARLLEIMKSEGVNLINFEEV